KSKRPAKAVEERCSGFVTAFARGMEKQKHAPKPELQHHAPSVTVFAGGKRTVGRDGQQDEPWHLYRNCAIISHRV
ncbi:MAG: hypothetical protein RI826_09780, partial [Chlorobium phaeovibrioides]|nr:hypothetical protein [Chlorobium phaeovibrioides]